MARTNFPTAGEADALVEALPCRNGLPGELACVEIEESLATF